ncbi:MAG: outer membrane protein transport protein [Desulfovibrio sp.]|nr:outer membrane protein transport protein [Desulfovibrio sp.]
MKVLHTACVVLVLVFCCTSAARGEGFALNEWSARGVSLANGLVGRADDVSALAYNAAGITQLPGTHFMGGLAFISPSGSVESYTAGGSHTTTAKPATWMAPHAFISHQCNDNVWLGFGVFSRFGLGNSYSGDWQGRYNMYDVGVQTLSFVPTLALKINEMFSVSVGLDIMDGHMYLGSKIPTVTVAMERFDNDMQLEGSGWGVGAHVGLHMRLNDQWSVGVSYKSQVTLHLNGDVEFGWHGDNLARAVAHLPEARDCNAEATLQLPDSLALGIAFKPLDNLSFEVGTTWTRWSTYNALNIYMEDYDSINNKEWRDGWNFNASVEYKPLDWWALRAGFFYETPVISEDHADFIVPTNGRKTLSLGMGFQWNNWALDLAYSHVWVNSTDYGNTRASGIRSGGIIGGQSKNVSADIAMFSLSYTF